MSSVQMTRRYSVAHRTHPGRIKSINQEAVAVVELGPESFLVAVAGGLGSARCGRTAARTVIKTLTREAEGWLPSDADTCVDWIHHSLGQAHRRLARKASDEPKLADMSTTILVAICTPQFVVYQHAGDCGLYWFRGNQLMHRSQDHVQAGEQPYSYLGPELAWARVQLDPDPCTPLYPEPGDWLLLATQGVARELPAKEIARLGDSTEAAEELSDLLLEAALEEGGRDNLTLAVVRTVSSSGPS